MEAVARISLAQHLETAEAARLCCISHEQCAEIANK
jgi:hypothetical protein